MNLTQWDLRVCYEYIACESHSIIDELSWEYVITCLLKIGAVIVPSLDIAIKNIFRSFIYNKTEVHQFSVFIEIRDYTFDSIKNL